MRRIFFIFGIIICLCFPVVSKAVVSNSSDINYTRVYLFSGDNCKECDSGKKWLDAYQKDDYKISVEYLNIENNKKLTDKVKSALNIKEDSVPFIVIGSNYFVGFNDKIEKKLNDAIKAYEKNSDYCDIVSKLRNDEDVKSCIAQNKGIYNQSSFAKVIIIVGIACLIVCIGIFLNKKKVLNRLHS